MTFSQLFAYFIAGVPIKRKPWLGYWKYDFITKEVYMYLKDGTVMKLIDTEDVIFTLSNIVKDDWEIATDEKCSIPVVR